MEEYDQKLAFIIIYDTHYQNYERKACGPMEDAETIRVMNGSVVSGQFSTTPKLIPTALCTPQLQTHVDPDLQELP